MSETPVVEEARAREIALIAHDNKKGELLEWARFNRELLARHHLYATGTTGHLIEKELGLEVHKFYTGPLGGDQQIGARIAEGGIDCLIFFWDPLEPHPHDMDVKALLRIAVVWNVPVACNRASADFIISSPLLSTRYVRLVPDYDRRDADGKVAVVGLPTDEDMQVPPEITSVATLKSAPRLDRTAHN